MASRFLTSPAYSFITVLTVLVLVAIGVGLPPTIAEPNRDLGIILSNTCLTMLKNNVSTNCPGYDEILPLFPDTSNRYVSGDFYYIDGILQRENRHLNNHFKLFEYTNASIRWIDPPGDIREKINKIEIASGDFVYSIKGQKLNGTAYVVGKDRYVSSTCSYAIINAANWLFLLGDTIWYMDNGCKPEFTRFQENHTISWKRTEHDITTSYKYQLDKWIEETKIRCLKKCFEY